MKRRRIITITDNWGSSNGFQEWDSDWLEPVFFRFLAGV